MKTIVILATLMLAGCGGTFIVRSDGSLSYTTPRYIEIAPSTK